MMRNDVNPAEIVTTVPVPKITVLTRIKSGMASWYGSVLQGHLTASGRRFNEFELTAAHRTLPFGSRVKVTDLRNKRSVVVTITDRGVLYPERVIDLSYGAAKELHMVRMGVDPVKLELITERS
jgi:rare lipoprotein A